jgi:hypothetical protein
MGLRSDLRKAIDEVLEENGVEDEDVGEALKETIQEILEDHGIEDDTPDALFDSTDIDESAEG